MSIYSNRAGSTEAEISEYVSALLALLGEEPGPARAQQWFGRLAVAVAPFRGLSYEALGAGGAMVAPADAQAAPSA